MGEKIATALKNRVVRIVLACAGALVMMVLVSFTTVKINAGSYKSVQVATDIVGQLSDQYLAPKFDAINARLDTLQTEVQKTNDWTAQKDDETYTAFVNLIDKQYEKYTRDKFDIKETDLREIDLKWKNLPDKYKTAMVIKEYDIAMAYYLAIRK